MRSTAIDPRPDADLVLAARDGDRDAFATLFERWFDRCYDVAVRIVVDRETAADVAQDTFLAAHRGLPQLRDPQAFGGWVLRTARNTALTRLARERRSTATDDDQVVRLLDREVHHDDPAVAVTRAEQHDLVWAAAAALGPRDASVLDLHLRHGLDATEIADALEITPNNAHQVLFRLRARLGGAVRAWVLWHGGAPRCDELASGLAAAGITSFGAPAVKVVDAHVPGCERCESERAGVLAPEAMFAAVPLLAAPPALRARVRLALEVDGVVPPAPSGAPPGDGTGSHPPSPADPRPHRRTHPHTPRIAAGVAVAALLLVVAILVLGGEEAEQVEETAADASRTSAPRAGDPDEDADPTPGSLAQSATTTTAPSTPSSTTLGAAGPSPSAPSTSTPATAPGPTPDGEPAADGAPDGGTPSSVAPPHPDPTTTVAPAAPAVVSFTATFVGLGPCGSASGRLWELAWEVTGASEVQLTGPNVASGPHPAAATAPACSGFGPAPTWQLDATGPGGTATAVATGT